MNRTGLAGIGLALSLAACAPMETRGVPAPGGMAERPVSERPVENAAQGRAKVHVDLGEAYFGSARYGVALDEARIAIEADPGYAPAYHLMANVYLHLADIATARAYYERAIALAPGDPEINNSYGWFLCASGETAAGLERLSLSMHNPYYRTPSQPYTNAGLCHLRNGDPSAAEASFAQAVRLDSKNVQALYQLADMAYRRDDYQTALTHLERLHGSREPTVESAWLGLRVARKLHRRDLQDSFAAQIGRRFKSSPEYQKMIQGNFE